MQRGCDLSATDLTVYAKLRFFRDVWLQKCYFVVGQTTICRTDVIFVLDSSQSVQRRNFRRMQAFVSGRILMLFSSVHIWTVLLTCYRPTVQPLVFQKLHIAIMAMIALHTACLVFCHVKTLDYLLRSCQHETAFYITAVQIWVV